MSKLPARMLLASLLAALLFAAPAVALSTSPLPGTGTDASTGTASTGTNGPTPSIKPADELIKRNSSGDVVVRIQDRLLDLDYFHFKSTGSFGTQTHGAVMKFQEYNKIMADGSVGVESKAILFSNAAIRNPIPDEVKIPIGPATNAEISEFGAIGEWAEIDKNMKLRFPYVIKDLNTGIEFNVTRVSGKNHAHVEPTSVIDLANFERIMGDEPNWNKRSVLVNIDGVRYAASLQCMPHGENTMPDKTMDGVLCLYFSGSRSEVLEFKDVEHQRFIDRAAGLKQ